MRLAWNASPNTRARRLMVGAMAVARVAFSASRASKKGDELAASEKRAAAGELAVAKLLGLGPTYIKLGQIASCRADVLPPEYIAALKRLQDDVPAFSGARARATVARELERAHGLAFDDVFESFDDTALAAASLGQVHRAVLKPNVSSTFAGAEVVIKIQRDDLPKLYDADLKNIRRILSVCERLGVSVQGAEQSWLEIFDDACLLLYREIDYKVEAGNMEVRAAREAVRCCVRTYSYACVSRRLLPLPLSPLPLLLLLLLLYRASWAGCPA